MTAAPDVVVLGGGLAGLTCALHLHKRCPDIRIHVLERRSHPAPEATHKVGESTVEIGAHYFSQVLGLESHLRECHLPKFGFRFFHSDGRDDIDGVQEIGVSRPLSVSSYQIDRGIFENYLVTRARDLGITVELGACVDGVDLAPPGTAQDRHAVRYRVGGCTGSLAPRWVIDASGRSSIIKRQLKLDEANGHDANAIWFRVPLRLDIEDWSADPCWLSRCSGGQRWRSTNHLVGEGYWVWLIPLSSGYHSVGIVADAGHHKLAKMNTFERALGWLDVHQPRLSRALRETGAKPTDFTALRRFSYGCREVFSPDRWALTGEAGVFLDPFYSPGSDFIAIANTYIVDLVERDLRKEPFAPYVGIYAQLFRSFYESTLTLYEGQYGLFADAEIMSAKVIWDYTYYWGILCQLFFQDRLTDVPMLGQVREKLLAARALNDAMQPFFRAWKRVSAGRNVRLMLDQAQLPWFAALNSSLSDDLDDAQFIVRIDHSASRLRMLAAETVGRVVVDHPVAATWPETLRVLALSGHEAIMDGKLLEYPLTA